MKNLRLVIRIHRPVQEVFAFLLNPHNTPQWIDSIVTEKTNEWPVRLGTIYRNQSRDGKWSEYTVTEYKEDEQFVFTKNDNNYHVRYTFTPLNEKTMELEYYEWVDRGDVEKPFTPEILQKLKRALENS